MGFQLSDSGAQQRIFRSFSCLKVLRIQLNQLMCTLQTLLLTLEFEIVGQAIDEGFGGLLAQISEKIRQSRGAS